MLVRGQEGEDGEPCWHVLTSETGTRQGDPTSPIFFSLAMHQVWRRMEDTLIARGWDEARRRMLVRWFYLDDVGGFGSAVDLVSMLEVIHPLLEEIGSSRAFPQPSWSCGLWADGRSPVPLFVYHLVY